MYIFTYNMKMLGMLYKNPTHCSLLRMISVTNYNIDTEQCSQSTDKDVSQSSKCIEEPKQKSSQNNDKNKDQKDDNVNKATNKMNNNYD